MPKRGRGRTPSRAPKKRKYGRKYKRRYKGYYARKSAAIKYLKGSKKFIAAVRRKRRAVKRKKKVNKAIRRVLTSMNDEKVTMYRQYIKPGITVKGTSLTSSIFDKDGTLSNGDYVATDNAAIRQLVRREDRDFFQINDFHGYVGPSWQRLLSNGSSDNVTAGNDGVTEDNMMEVDIGVRNANSVTSPPASGFNYNAIDTRAYKEFEIPMLPCVPLEDHSLVTSSAQMYYQAFSRFGRRGDKIKILNNYMRFDFFAVRNGELKYGANSVVEGITGDHCNVDFVYQAGAKAEFLDGSNYTHTAANARKDYKIISPRFCKVRFILFERECYHKDPVKLNDFLKDYDPATNLAFNDFDMGTAECKQMDIFNRGKKTQRDLTDPTNGADKDIVDQLLLKMKGKCVIDSTRNIPMNKKTSIIFNPLKGKVLSYDPNEVLTTNDEGQNRTNTATNANEYVTQNLPTHVNAVRAMDNSANSIAKYSEYIPKNKQYGMFMLIYTSRCAVEYDIFQKFEYDK